MSKKSEKLDKIQKILQKIPIVNRFETDKLIVLVKAIWVEPLVVLFSLGLSFSIIEYYNHPNKLILNIILFITLLLTIFVFAYIIKAMYIVKKKEETKIYQTKQDARKEKLNLIEKVYLSQEGLRGEWHQGWREILIKKNSYFHEILRSAMSLPINGPQVIDMILGQIEKVEEEYQNLFNQISNPYKEMIIGMKKPIPNLDLSNHQVMKEINAMLKEMENLDQD